MTIKQTSRNLPARIISCILTVCLLLCMLTACQPQDSTLGSSFPTTPTDKPPVPTTPRPTEPLPTEPTPTKPAPTEPAPTEPVPTEPAPTEPAPTEPAPTEPVPTEPAPTEPAPTEPSPPAEEIPQWLLFSWSTISRSDKPAANGLPAISYLYSNELFLGSDGTGYQVYREWSNYDEYGLAEEWIPANKEDTQNPFTYILSDNRVYITFTKDDSANSTVVFTIQQQEDRSYILMDENSTIYKNDSVGQYLQRVCYLFGIDYGLPPLENSIPVSWLTGIWDHMEREDYSYGTCVLRSQYFNFYSSGEGDFYYNREWSNYNKYGTMTGEWNYLTEQPTSRRFSYSVRGEKLILFYKTGETEVYTAQLKGSDYLLLTNTQTGETLQYAKAYSNYSLKKMCDLLGIDYSLPRTVYDLSSHTWQMVWRKNTNSGAGIIYHVSIRFNYDGTADYTRKVYQSGTSWNEVPERCMTGSFRYERNQYYLTISNITGDVDLYEGNYTLYQKEDGYMYFHEPQGEPEHEYETLYAVPDGTSLEQLCGLCKADYTLPPIKEPDAVPTIDQLSGTWQTFEREDWQGGVYALRYQTYTFRADGTGENLRGCYCNLDDNSNYLDHWVEGADDRWTDSFAYTYSNGTLTMDGISYTVTITEDGILCLTDPYQFQMKFVKTQSDPSLYEVCQKLGVDSSVPLRNTALQGTYTHIEPTKASDGTASLTATDYRFAPDGTGSQTIREYNAAEGKWDSITLSFTYQLEDMLYVTYDNGNRAYFEVFIIDAGIISISDDWEQYVKFVDNELAPTLEEQCKILGVKNPIAAN